MKSAKIFIIFTFLLAFALGLYTTFATGINTQQNPFPNELKGYEFFGEGKLKTLKLGFSKRKDVKDIFGKSCEKSCNYDENFKIKFEYLAALDDCMTTEDIRDRTMCPQNEFIGTISSIIIEPRQSQILREVSTSKFSKFSGGTTAEKGSDLSISYTSFTDKYGLKYSIINNPPENSILHSQYPPFVGGKLYSINYVFTNDMIRKIFTVEYNIREQELKN
ncbi:MAG TPA: hypothetical protein PKY82_03310 [Pyrinomonadaceae bacterium]|nr:hypothetical protein [Pyrinomonadaceae bacterium]